MQDIPCLSDQEFNAHVEFTKALADVDVGPALRCLPCKAVRLCSPQQAVGNMPIQMHWFVIQALHVSSCIMPLTKTMLTGCLCCSRCTVEQEGVLKLHYDT